MMIPFGQISFPELFENELVGPVFRPFAEQMIEKVAPRPGESLLDMACGTGIVARLAHERMQGAGTVIGVDVSPGMISVARKIAPQITWREGDAASLPIEAGERFDVVTCQQGLQFFPDRTAAMREMHDALRPGGRIALSTWRPDDEVPFGHRLREVAERQLGPVTDRRHCFGESKSLEALFLDAGFKDVEMEIVHRTVRFADPNVFALLNAIALVGMTDAAKQMTEGERMQKAQQIANDSASVVRDFTDAKGLAFDISTNVVTGKRV